MKKYRYALLHLAFFYGGLISGSGLMLLLASVLVGFLPRVKQGFGYYFIVAVAALALAMFLQMPETVIMEKLENILPLGPVPFWAVVGLISGANMAVTAIAINRLLLPKQKDRVFGRNN